MNQAANHGESQNAENIKKLRVSASPWLARVLLWVLPLTFLTIFFFLPLAKILFLTLDVSALNPENLQITNYALRFTFYQASLSTLLTLLLGLPSAYLFARYDFYGKSLLRALTAVPFMLPTVVVAAAFNAILGTRGLLSFLFPLSSLLFHPSPFILILLAHVFYNTTIIIRIVGNALSSLDPKLEHAARSLSADTFHVWRHVTLPLLHPALFAATLLVFLFDFTSFGVILLLGGSQYATLEVEIYIQAVKQLHLSTAALLFIFAPRLTLHTATRPTLHAHQTQNHPTKTLRRLPHLSSFIFLPPASRLASNPLPLPPRGGSWSAWRSSIWFHNGLL